MKILSKLDNQLVCGCDKEGSMCTCIYIKEQRFDVASAISTFCINFHCPKVIYEHNPGDSRIEGRVDIGKIKENLLCKIKCCTERQAQKYKFGKSGQDQDCK